MTIRSCRGVLVSFIPTNPLLSVEWVILSTHTSPFRLPLEITKINLFFLQESPHTRPKFHTYPFTMTHPTQLSHSPPLIFPFQLFLHYNSLFFPYFSYFLFLSLIAFLYIYHLNVHIQPFTPFQFVSSLSNVPLNGLVNSTSYNALNKLLKRAFKMGM